jgi:cell division ATPase FtsA
MAKSQKMTPVAVFDISSGSVAGAHVLIAAQHTEKTPVSFLASTRIPSETKEEVTIERFIDSTITQLSSVITTLKKADAHHPKSVQVLLASPWFVSQTRTIVYTKPEAFVCTQKLIDSLVEKEVAYIIEHDMERFGAIAKEGVIVEKQLSMIKLNGYPTTFAVGKKGQSLELFLVVTVSPKLIIERFKDEIHKGYTGSTIRFTTSPYATFVVARDFLAAPKESLIIDIGEEITDIACVKDELFLYHHSFPSGTYELYRTLATSGHSNITESHALIESFTLAKLSAAMTSTVQKALDDFTEVWKRQFQESISTSRYAMKIPEIIYLTADDTFISFFSTILKHDPFVAHAVSTTTTVVSFDRETLSSYASSLDPNHIDETLIVGSLFACRLL